MRTVVTTVIVLVIVVLSFLTGSRFGNGRPDGGERNEPVYGLAAEGQEDAGMPETPGAVFISPGRQQLIGVKAATVGKEPMTYPLRLYGKVVADETRIYRVNSSTDCWIKAVSDVTTGSIVRKNQLLAEALAPAYYNAQLTYLIALDNVDRIKQQLGGELRAQQGDIANNQIRLAVQALQNLGISDAQTEELANTRQARPYLQVRAPTEGVVLSRKISLNQWFKAAEEFYTIADIGRVWIYADVYEDEAEHMGPGMNVEVRHPQTGRSFRARVGQVLPLFDPGARTLKVRIDVDNPRYDLRPDMFVDVMIPVTIPASVHIPADAVLYSGKKAVVYVDSGKGIFEPRKVKTGWRRGGRVEVIEGLTPGEKVVVSGNFLIDSESRMEPTASGIEPDTPDEGVSGAQDGKGRLGGSRKGSPFVQVTGPGWLDSLRPPVIAHGEEPAGKAAPARDWSGWGKFPGAEYLGLKHTTRNISGQETTTLRGTDRNPAQATTSGPDHAPSSARAPDLDPRPAHD